MKNKKKNLIRYLKIWINLMEEILGINEYFYDRSLIGMAMLGLIGFIALGYSVIGIIVGGILVNHIYILGSHYGEVHW